MTEKINYFQLMEAAAEYIAKDRPVIRCCEDIADLLRPLTRNQQREMGFVLFLDIKCTVISIENIAIGGLTSAQMQSREIFKGAIVNSAHSIIIAHNHPSGDPEPSFEDFEFTKKVVAAGKILEIPVYDHVILGDKKYEKIEDEYSLTRKITNGYYSFKSNGTLNLS